MGPFQLCIVRFAYMELHGAHGCKGFPLAGCPYRPPEPGQGLLWPCWTGPEPANQGCAVMAKDGLTWPKVDELQDRPSGLATMRAPGRLGQRAAPRAPHLASVAPLPPWGHRFAAVHAMGCFTRKFHVKHARTLAHILQIFGKPGTRHDTFFSFWG